MNGFSAVHNKLLLAALAFLPAAFVPQASAGTIALPVTTNVNVTNTSLPVTGSISVNNTAANPLPVSITGNVSVAGTSNVSVTNTPSVNVANGTLNVSDVNNPAFQPWTYTLPTNSFACSTTGPAEIYIPPPPAGRTLVIESVNFVFTMPDALSPYLVAIGTWLTTQGGSKYALQSMKEGSDGTYTYFVTSQTTRLYSQTGSGIGLSVSPFGLGTYNGNNQVCILNASISGYLVNTP